jgi:glycosyltransferase involved in cell wall biosynthesis
MNIVLMTTKETIAVRSDTVYILGGVSGGGSSKFINDLKSVSTNIVHITSRDMLYKLPLGPDNILMVQQLFPCDITMEDILFLKYSFRSRVIINIHDFTLLVPPSHIRKNPNAAHNLYLKNITPIITPLLKEFFHEADLVIHPSQFTYDEYAKYFSTHNFILTEHIDISGNTSQRIPIIQKKIINIGILHTFIQCKGSEICIALIKQITSYKDYTIKFHVAGVNMPAYKESEYFSLLQEKNIHGLFFLNKWGETYSYALTKFLLSGLPILYNNFGSARSRMSESNPLHFKVYEKEADYLTNVHYVVERFYAMLDFIIANQTDNEQTFTVHQYIPPLYASILRDKDSLWPTLFEHTKSPQKNPGTAKNIFIVSSAICTSNKPLSYYKSRSVYSDQSRMYQTLQTIYSIRKYVPDSGIILVDATLHNEEWKNVLRRLTDVFVDLSADERQVRLANECPLKGIAECEQVLAGYDMTETQFPSMERIFKISGRYFLTPTFTIANYINEKCCFKTIPTTSILFEPHPAYYTFLYCIQKEHMAYTRTVLQRMIDDGYKNKLSNEVNICSFFEKRKITEVHSLGVAGFIGPFGKYIVD